jgi:hypothetical protein
MLKIADSGMLISIALVLSYALVSDNWCTISGSAVGSGCFSITFETDSLTYS